MKYLMTVSVIAILLWGAVTGVQAQQASVATGGEATGTGGTISHSSGQTDYLYFSSEESGSMQFGVQQVFDHFLLFTWTGNQSSVWMIEGNWSFNRTPVEGEETIIIPSGRPRYPILDVLQEVVDLSIEPGATLTIAPDGRLTVTGTLENAAGFEGLVIQSDAAATGSLLHYKEGVQATIYRFISGDEHAWHQLSSPVAAQDMEDAFVDGNIFAWHEPSQSWVSFHNTGVWPTWADVNEEHSNFIPAKGYLVAYPYEGGNPQTKMFSGAVNQGPQAFSLQRKAHPDDSYEGFNLMGNPYPSSIDWNSEHGWSGLGHLQSPAIWIWNEQAGQYGSYHSESKGNKGTHGVSRYIAPMQAFWVRANASEQLGLDNALRLHSDQAWLKQHESISGVLHLAVTGDASPWGDELMLEFGHPSGHGGAEKMFSIYPEAPSLYSHIEETPYSISFHGQATEHTIVPLGFTPGAEGLFAITAEGAEHFEQIYLVDRQLGFYHDLHLPGSYEFAAGPDDDPMRFELRFGPADPTAIHEPADVSNVWCYENTLYINTDSDDLRLILLDINGRHLRSFRPGRGKHAYPLDLPPGIYVVQSFTAESITSQLITVR